MGPVLNRDGCRWDDPLTCGIREPHMCHVSKPLENPPRNVSKRYFTSKLKWVRFLVFEFGVFVGLSNKRGKMYFTLFLHIFIQPTHFETSLFGLPCHKL